MEANSHEDRLQKIRADSDDRIAQLQARIEEVTTSRNEELQRLGGEKNSMAQEIGVRKAYRAMIEAKTQKDECEWESARTLQ